MMLNVNTYTDDQALLREKKKALKIQHDIMRDSPSQLDRSSARIEAYVIRQSMVKLKDHTKEHSDTSIEYVDDIITQHDRSREYHKPVRSSLSEAAILRRRAKSERLRDILHKIDRQFGELRYCPDDSLLLREYRWVASKSADQLWLMND